MTEQPSIKQVQTFVTSVALAALVGVGAWISIPIGPVPITLQVLFVYLATILLRPKFALLSMLLYVVMGLIGLPVYASGGSGLAVLIGPTGGYLFGFILGATIGATAFRAFAPSRESSRLTRVLVLIGALVLCAAIIHATGALWGKYQTGLGWRTILMTWVLPFLPIDGVKIVVAAFIADEIRRRGILITQ
jgi:biotin transport system substrate-specific component